MDSIHWKPSEAEQSALASKYEFAKVIERTGLRLRARGLSALAEVALEIAEIEVSDGIALTMVAHYRGRGEAGEVTFKAQRAELGIAIRDVIARLVDGIVTRIEFARNLIPAPADLEECAAR